MDIPTALYNVRDMLATRGEDVHEFDEELKEIQPDKITEFQHKIFTFHSDKTVVFFTLTRDLLSKDKHSLLLRDDGLKKGDFQTFSEEHGGRKNYIIVGHEVPSSVVNTFLLQKDKEFQANGGILQFFRIHELQYNPFQHVLVPKHEKMSDDEAKSVLTQYSIRKAHLPIILKTDVIARWLGLKHGELVRIQRFNTNSGENTYYRCCM
jgi:DNA-directed RNA polymerase subunit H (RpoH/RPB5)